MNLPDDYLEPDWSKFSRAHCWRRYISDELKEMWPSLSKDMRASIARNAQDIADREEWE